MSSIDITKPITDERAAVQFMEEFVYSVSFQRANGPRYILVRLWFFFGEDTVEIPEIKADDLISAMEKARLVYLDARERQRDALVKKRNEVEMQLLDLNKGLP